MEWKRWGGLAAEQPHWPLWATILVVGADHTKAGAADLVQVRHDARVREQLLEDPSLRRRLAQHVLGALEPGQLILVGIDGAVRLFAAHEGVRGL